MTSTETPQQSPADDPRPAPRRRGLAAAIVAATLVVLLGGVYLAGYFAAGDSVPRNATVGGIAIGGLSRDEAVAKLEAEYGPRADAPLTVRTAGGPEAELQPSQAGLAMDYAATVDDSGVGQSFAPAHIWRVLTGGGPVEPVASVDQAALGSAVEAMAAGMDREPVDATIAFEDGAVKRTDSVDALKVDREAAARAIERAYLTTNAVDVKSTTTSPEITTEEVAEVATTWAEPAVSGPVRVETQGGAFDVTPKMIASAAVFDRVDGTIKPRIDNPKLFEAVQPAIDKLKLDKPKNASFTFEGGRPVVVPGKDGVGFEVEPFAAAVVPAITQRENRVVKLEAKGTAPKFTTADAEKMGIKEVTGEFTTYYPHADYRNTNIGRAATKINGTLLKPGETFSFNDVVGERTSGNGFVEGWKIDQGKLVEDTGGGVSQGVTTMYNAAFFAGMKDTEHWPHTLYFDRYPAGREATVAWPSKDLKFTNDTPHGVVIQGFINPSSSGKKGSVTFRVWSTKYYEVKTAEPVKSDAYRPKPPIADNSSTCHAQSAAEGFTATYWRELYRDGSLVRPRENYKWTYNAQREIRCG